jgi:hypothetical protein
MLAPKSLGSGPSFFRRHLIALADPPCPRYSTGMSIEPPKPPDSPWRLTGARLVLLALGALMLAYIVAAFSGSLTNYQAVKEGAQQQKAQQAAPAETTPAPAN